MSVGKDDVETDIDSNDESKTRTYKSTLTVICGNRQQKPDAVTKGIQTLIDTNDESRDRDNRWSMSKDQHSQQLVTSVRQSRNVEPTVVNMCRVWVFKRSNIKKSNSLYELYPLLYFLHDELAE